MRQRRWHVLVVFAGLFANGLNVTAAERLLTIGGGYSPSGNQVSLEKNVQFYQRVLPRLKLADAPHHLLFADGNDPAPDLKVRDPQFAADSIIRDLAAIIGKVDGLDERYRTHQLTGVQGAATIANIDAWVTAQSSWRPDERLLLYYTGHGGGGKQKSPRNTNLQLWDGEVFSVTDLVKRLDRLPADVPVILIMVQCHSGGFADVIFANGESNGELSPQPRCGFFSTVPERAAAGCTPDINEENYQDFSTYFWTALSGETRQGHPITQPDYDLDGRVSLAEAHAYVSINSPTIDIPIKTSEIFLRRFSRLDDDSYDARHLDSPYSTLRDAADPVSRAVLDGISKALALSGDERLTKARSREQALGTQRKEIEKQLLETRMEVYTHRMELAKALQTRWPELTNPFHPRLYELVSDEDDPLGTFLREQETWKKFYRTRERLETLGFKKREIDRQQAKFLRFLRAAENVVLEGNLPLLNDEALVRRYHALRALEGSVPGIGE